MLQPGMKRQEREPREGERQAPERKSPLATVIGLGVVLVVLAFALVLFSLTRKPATTPEAQAAPADADPFRDLPPEPPPKPREKKPQ